MSELQQSANPLDSAEVFTMEKGEALKKFREYAGAARASRRKEALPASTRQRNDRETFAGYTPSGYWDTHRAPAPVIPPQHRPTLPLSQHWLLWHVEEWKRVAPVDPMLILPFGANGLGVVVAHWDLTPVERMVMGALLGQ
jgi:hypothetical protein